MDNQKGFFKKLWTVIKPIMGITLGGLIGGPIGALVGAAVQSFIDTGTFSNPFGEFSLGPNAGQKTTSTEPIEYPVSDAEHNALVAWFSDKFGPTIKNLANSIDTVIEVTTRSKSLTLDNTVINNANKVLRAIATMRAYNSFILQNGESAKGSLIGFARTENFIKTKVNFTEHYLKILEKAVLDYMESNNGDRYRLVEVPFEASKTSNVELVTFNWNGKKVTTTVAQYEHKSKTYNSGQLTNGGNNSEQLLDGNQTGNEVTVIDTDPTTSTPATTNNDGAILVEESNSSGLKKIALAVGVGYLISKIANK